MHAAGATHAGSHGVDRMTDGAPQAQSTAARMASMSARVRMTPWYAPTPQKVDADHPVRGAT